MENSKKISLAVLGPLNGSVKRSHSLPYVIVLPHSIPHHTVILISHRRAPGVSYLCMIILEMVSQLHLREESLVTTFDCTGNNILQLFFGSFIMFGVLLLHMLVQFLERGVDSIACDAAFFHAGELVVM